MVPHTKVQQTYNWLWEVAQPARSQSQGESELRSTGSANNHRDEEKHERNASTWLSTAVTL